MDNPIFICRIISLWIILSIGFVIYFSIKESIDFQIGPNPDLFILQIAIDTKAKYITVILFCFSNSIFRSLQHNVLQPWIINNIQDTTNLNKSINHLSSYEISIISTIYTWFDFFMYMNILMSQMDLFLVEVSVDVIITIIITNYYLRQFHIEDVQLANRLSFASAFSKGILNNKRLRIKSLENIETEEEPNEQTERSRFIREN
jgi:hypothetical protein